jgi:hypothetical protein
MFLSLYLVRQCIPHHGTLADPLSGGGSMCVIGRRRQATARALSTSPRWSLPDVDRSSMRAFERRRAALGAAPERNNARIHARIVAERRACDVATYALLMTTGRRIAG